MILLLIVYFCLFAEGVKVNINVAGMVRSVVANDVVVPSFDVAKFDVDSMALFDPSVTSTVLQISTDSTSSCELLHAPTVASSSGAIASFNAAESSLKLSGSRLLSANATSTIAVSYNCTDSFLLFDRYELQCASTPPSSFFFIFEIMI